MKRASKWIYGMCLLGLCAPVIAQSLPHDPTDPPSERVLEKMTDKELSTVEQVDSKEDLDLEESKPAPEPSCGESIPHVGPIGVWPQVTKSMTACAARLVAEPLLLQMMPPLSKSLWCDDVSGLKSKERKEATDRQALQKASQESEGQPLKKHSTEEAKKEGLAGFLQWTYPLRQRDNKPLSSSPLQSITPTKEPALMWDEREAKTCSHWGSYSAELWPSVAVYAVGKAQINGASCPAALIEVSPQTGRYAGSRNYMIIGVESCAGNSPALKLPFASAFNSVENAKSWLDQLLVQTKWQGPAPRAPRPASIRRP